MSSPFYKNNRSILLGQDNNALVYLFAINALVFLLINFVQIIYYLSDIPIAIFDQQILNWFTLPADAAIFVSRPWTLLVYMFTHQGLWHLVSSSLWLWCFGFILQDLAGNHKLIPIYIYGGVTGGIVFIAMNNLFPILASQVSMLQPLLGAGPAIMAVAIATTTLAPNYRMFPLISGGIPLWVLTLVFLAFHLITLANANLGVSLAHLTAGLIGFLYVQHLRSGHDWGAWMIQLVNWLNDLFNPHKQPKNTTAKEQANPASHYSEQKISNETQKKLDAILDKINQQGLSFLTEEEKTFLQKASSDE